jgi:tetratricopeptide (TPR) repeat protein
MMAILSEIQQFGAVAQSLFSIITNIFVIGLVIIAIAFIVRVLSNNSYSIRQINVPTSFELAGHSGPVIANRIHIRLNEIIQRVSATQYAKGYTLSAMESDVSVDVAGMGLPLKGFIALIGGALGIKRNKRIDADIFVEGSLLIMLLRITGQSTERFETPLNDNLGIPIRDLILKASETILQYSNDESLQAFFGHIERDGEKAIKLAKHRLEKAKSNYTRARLLSAWARGLSLLKKFEEAEEKIKDGITLNPNEGRLYNVWGLMLQEQGNHEEAKTKLMKASSLMRSKETKFRRSNVLTGIGMSFSKLNQSTSAIDYYSQAIKMDDNAHASYFHLSKEHLLTKDYPRFFELLEKSLIRGLKPQLVLQDPDLKVILDDPQMKKLLVKYAE